MQAATAAAPAKGSIFDPTGGRPVHPSFRRSAEPKSASPTLITLQIKSKGEPLKNIEEASRKAGFKYPSGSGCDMGLVSSDTNEMIASVTYRQWDALNGCLMLVEVQIDPEAAPIERCAGFMLKQGVELLAKNLGAVICDGMGRALSAKAFCAASDYIDAVMERRFRAAEKEADVKLADGTLRRPGPVSFQHTLLRKIPGRARKREEVDVLFDVPALEYRAAKGLACRMVIELKDNFGAHRLNRPNMVEMLGEVLGGSLPQYDFAGVTHGNVARAFLDILETVMANGLAVTGRDQLIEQAEKNEDIARSRAEAAKGGAA